MLDRRTFLKAALAVTTTAATDKIVLANGSRPWLHMEQMPLYIKRGKEEFKIDLREVGHFATFRYATRDVRANVVGNPDPHLAGLLSWMQAVIATRTGAWVPFVITSGLRTKETNDRTEGAARNSMHLPDKYGIFRATDIHTPKINARDIAHLAMLAQEGGVGIYSSRGFIHVDTGNVRTWGS